MNELFPDEVKGWLPLLVELLPSAEREAVQATFTELVPGSRASRRRGGNRRIVYQAKKRGLERLKPWVTALADTIRRYLDDEET